MNELWDVSFQPQHLKGGFRGSGLHPFSRAAIQPSKLTPSIAVQAPSQQEEGEAVAATSTTVELSCSKCGSSMTPMKLHMVAYFSKHLEGKKQGSKCKRRVKPTFYGEALTTSEVLERMEEQDREKERKEKEKRDRKKKREQRVKEKDTNGDETDEASDDGKFKITCMYTY